MKQIILSIFVLLHCCNAFSMQFGDEDLSPFDYKEADEKTIDFNNLNFTQGHKPKSKFVDPKDPELVFKIKAYSVEGVKAGSVWLNSYDPCSILRLHVYQFAKGNWVGKKLLEQAVAWSKSQGCTQVSGLVFDAKRDFYQACGATCEPASFYADGLTICRYTIHKDKA